MLCSTTQPFATATSHLLTRNVACPRLLIVAALPSDSDRRASAKPTQAKPEP